MPLRAFTRLAILASTIVAAISVANPGLALADHDPGQLHRDEDEAGSLRTFGIVAPLRSSSTASISAAEANADPTRLVTLAGQLRARVVTAGVAGANVDMMALWPNESDPQWLIACNEQGTTQPGLQRIRISDGLVETIVTGTTSCDPAHRTPWGTIVFGEESGGGPNGGRVYELIDPLHTTGVTLDRTTGTFSGGTGASNLVARPALGRNSYEGIGVLPSGVTYYGDESRPAGGTAGGAYFKFIPAALYDPASGPITDLSQSPYVAGSLYGLRLGQGSSYGQGSETGTGTWVAIPAAPDPDLRAQAAALKLTGYYRPEDLAFDGVALANGNVRFCANNTGNETVFNYGNTVCVTDGTLAQAAANAATPEVQLFVVGTPQLAMMDNVAYQPHRGNWVLHEDGEQLQGNNDLWDCARDGADDDLLSDACIRIATLNDLNAEWTGGLFDASGKRFFVSVQHNVTGRGIVLEITGWK